jgi:hypothetical protein
VVEKDLHLIATGKQKERKGLGIRYNLQRHALSVLLPPGRPYLLKFSPLPKIMLPSRD